MLAPVGEATWGEDRLLELALASHRLWPEFAAELAEAAGSEIGYLPLGALHVALDRDEAAELRRRYELCARTNSRPSGSRPTRLPRARAGARRRAATAACTRRTSPQSTRAQLVGALAVAFERAGGGSSSARSPTQSSTASASPASRVADGAERSRRTRSSSPPAPGRRPRGCPTGRGRPCGRSRARSSPSRGPAPRPVCERIVVSERVYAVPRADGAPRVGATVEEQGFDLRVTAGGVHELLREAYRVLPEIAELELVETIAGLRPATPDNLPLVGPGAVDGLVLATGHFRNGILLAPLTGERSRPPSPATAPEAVAPFDRVRFALDSGGARHDASS